MTGPRYVLWEITLACNLRCRHCLAEAGHAAGDELTTAEALTVADDLAAAGAGAVCLMGGEPLCRPDWADLAARLAGHDIPVGLATNGLLLDDATARRARDLGVNQVVVSLAAPTSASAARAPSTAPSRPSPPRPPPASRTVWW